jgi:hypothetical protein
MKGVVEERIHSTCAGEEDPGLELLEKMRKLDETLPRVGYKFKLGYDVQIFGKKDAVLQRTLCNKFLKIGRFSAQQISSVESRADKKGPSPFPSVFTTTANNKLQMNPTKSHHQYQQADLPCQQSTLKPTNTTEPIEIVTSHPLFGMSFQMLAYNRVSESSTHPFCYFDKTLDQRWGSSDIPLKNLKRSSKWRTQPTGSCMPST